MGDKVKKQVLKLHKQFLDEIEACHALERQGQQGMSSLVNIAQRMPLVSAEKAKFGVLANMEGVRTLLTQRHFESLESTSLYMGQVMSVVLQASSTTHRCAPSEGFFDRVENMQRAMSTCADVLDNFNVQDMLAIELMEWMENVLAMYEREYPFDNMSFHTAARKKALGKDLEYANVADLQSRHSRWMSSCAAGYVDASYVSAVVLANRPKP
ncbi:Aste57867_8800 [Aphanomyces stellatus]|uniref:Aste57867_8800 protein n=1 Tax=Aphanomyces stellatus TaxID=120398 RepID=A0A485KL73_9STRA|nr:hypothetical protein As57867_008765 [Aphanomyces stellatus]VFT85686.1 Aste57867_8800 [Aphanomyces stellatus]